jgi:CheY-like chemotaxis protein
MFADPKNQARAQPLIAKVLVVDPTPHAGRMMSAVLRNIGPCEIGEASSLAQAWSLAETFRPSLIFVAQEPEMDGLAFTRRLRRADTPSRERPVVLTISDATAGLILAARDAGVNEILRKPYTLGDIVSRLEALLRERDWIESQDYAGPDRRRRAKSDFSGPFRRALDHIKPDPPERPDRTPAAIALQVLPLALRLMEGDPRQAYDLLGEQARGLRVRDDAVGAAAIDLGDFLGKALGAGPLTRGQVRARTEKLLAALQVEASPQV